MSSEEDSLCMRDSNVQAVYRIQYIVQAGQTSTTTDQLSQEGRSVEQTMSSDPSEDSLRMCDSNVPAVDVVQAGQTTTTTTTITTYTEQVPQEERSVDQSVSSEEDSVRMHVSDIDVPAVDVVQAGQTTTNIFEIINKDYLKTTTTRTEQLSQEERSVDQSVTPKEDSLHMCDSDVMAVDVVQVGQTTTTTTTTERVPQEERSVEQSVSPKEDSVRMWDSDVKAVDVVQVGQTATTTITTEQLSHHQEERSVDQSVSSEEDSVRMHVSNVPAVDVVQVGQTTTTRTTTTITTEQLSQEERSVEQTVTPEEDSLSMHDSDIQEVDVVQADQTATTTTTTTDLEQLSQEEMSTEQSMSSEEESLHDGDVQAIVDVAVWRRNKIFKCVECSYQTPLKTNLLLHKTRRHAVQTGIPTTKTPPQEEKPKSSSDGLPKTLKLIKKLSTCEVCGFQTSSKSNLLRHKKRRHSNQALTPTTWTLSREGRLKSSAGGRPEVLIPVTPSTGKKLHLCDVCGIQCSTKSNLKRHKLRHVAGKPNKPPESSSKTSTVGKSGPETQNTTENVDTNNRTSIDMNNPPSINTNNPTSIDINNPTSINTNNPTSINANNLTSINTNNPTSINTNNPTSINANNPTSINANCLTIVDTNNPRRSHLTTSFYAKSLKRPTYKCNLCEYTSAYQVTMRYHKMIHTGEKPFMCGTCGYRAKRKSTLAKHMRIHTGEKPYACDQCDYRAVQKAHLDRHVRRKHAMTSAAQ